MSDPTIKLEVDQRAADYITDQVDQLADTIQQDEDAKAQVAKEEQQAEDGIRDPDWSRGLGDVYKRQ